MMNMSELDTFLWNLQVNNNPYATIYKTYSDRLFSLGACIVRVHKGDRLNPLTQQEELENSGMNSIRVTIIENNFALMCNKWKICSQFQEFKLGQEHPHTKEQLAVCNLMAK